ncbi:hypothetical protein KJ784_00570 [Patescibacteria group bacterium]|nr:hypothetical protein [Patescibacteria group bacterium]
MWAQKSHSASASKNRRPPAAPAKASPWPPRSAWQAGWLRRCGRAKAYGLGRWRAGRLRVAVKSIIPVAA